MKKKHVVHHKTPKQSVWTSVTPISKALAFAFFILFPIIGFILGMNYERAMTVLNNVSSDTNVRFEKLPSPSPVPGY